MNDKGFTIAEIMVSLVLFGILVSISIWSVLAWQDSTAKTKRTEYAQNIYLTAQKSLTSMEAGNVLESFWEELSAGKSIDKSSLVTDSSTKEGILTCLMADKGDYTKYMSGEKTSSESAGLLFKLLGGISDPEVLDASICIEIEREENRIYSVIYSEAADGFAYSQRAGMVDISDRTYTSIREKGIGYYGEE